MAAAHWQLAAILAVAWTLTLLYGEWLQWIVHAPLCRDILPKRSEVRPMNRAAYAKHYTVAIISNPGLLESTGRAFLAYKFRNDLQLRRRFRSCVIHRAAPDLVVVLGDLFSEPIPQYDTEEWDSSIRRYKHIFNPVVRAHVSRRSMSRGKRKPIARVLQIPGPDDVEGVEAVKPEERAKKEDELFSRFSSSFTLDLNFLESSQPSYTLVGINSVAADGNQTSHHTSTFWSFVDQAANSQDKPRIMLSPLPLYSPLGTSCLSLRHNNWVEAHPPQEISKNSTAKIVAALQPQFVVASGHTPETCWQASQAPSAGRSAHKAVEESMAKGATLEEGQIMLASFNPARTHSSAPFLLLSTPIANPFAAKNSTAPPLHLQLCITPSQYGLILWHYLLLVASVLAFLLTPPRSSLPLDELTATLQEFRNQFKKAKLKVDDGQTEYVEVVDAEGNIILAPKIVSDDAEGAGQDVARTSDRKEEGLLQRVKGPAVAPEAAPEVATLGVFAPVKQVRSWLSVPVSSAQFLNRLVSSAGPLAALVGCQLALYMGMLASDWA